MSDDISWSDWLDTSTEQTSTVPEAPGVFMMHAAMKILYIGGSGNMRETLEELFKKECTSEAKRFKYASFENYASKAEELLKEYRAKHDGNLPKCMQ